jgi:chromosome segregation ATPase
MTGYELPTQITNNGILSANATINDNFGRLEFRLNQEVNDRKNAITQEVSDRNIAISSAISAIVDKDDDGTINKLAEVIEWINNNPSTATEMQKAIQGNTKAISDEAALARSEEGKITAALTTETERATTAEQANTTAIGNEKTRAENIEKGLQDQIDTLQTWKETATEDIANLNNTISQLLQTINDLTTRIENLENPPQEPDEGGETV